MLGAIVGDVIGSVHEWRGTKSKDFPLFEADTTFTDDTVLTVAVADWLLHGRNLVDLLHEYPHAYPGRGYGGMFCVWFAERRREPYHSYGNGAAMRVSPVGFACPGIDAVLERAAAATIVTHDHPEGIRGAQATAAAIHYALSGLDRGAIQRGLESRFGYDLRFRLDEIRPTYAFDESCQGTVPQAIVAFLESTDFEDAIRNAISLGGDADTLACITGGIAEAFYGGVPEELASQTLARLDPPLRRVVTEFRERFGPIAGDMPGSGRPAPSRWPDATS